MLLSGHIGKFHEDRYKGLMMRKKRHLNTDIILCVNKHSLNNKKKHGPVLCGWTLLLTSFSSCCESSVGHSQCRQVRATHSRRVPSQMDPLYNQSVSWKLSLLMSSVILFKRARLRSHRLSSPT